MSPSTVSTVPFRSVLRRCFYRSTALLAVVSCFLFGGCGEEGIPRQGVVPAKPRPVLLITVDTTRADRLQPYGASDVATPTLAAMAQRGVVFQHAYSVAPITLVAHTSILTGLYPPQHGVRNNGTHYADDGLTSLAEILRDEGWRTAAFVSASVLEKRYGLAQGFEVYDDDLSAGRERHPRVVPDRPAEATVAAAKGWLDTVEADERFFLWVHFYDPHAAYSPPPPYRDTYRERLYDGEIAYMDEQIGKLLEHPRLARASDLVVSVLGDHGESLGEHGEQTHAILAYDSTLRVPWLLEVPGGPAGMGVKEPVSQVDLVPTLLELLGLDVPEGLPGRNVLRFFDGGGVGARPTLYSETYLPYYTYGWSKLKVLRRGFFKYIDAPTPELYDLERDPSELSNVHAQRPGAAHDLERDLGELLSSIGDPEREAALELDAEAADKLRSLGYLSFGNIDPSAVERPDPKDVVDLHVRLERARRLMRDRLYDAAERELRRVLERDPGNLAALVELAMVFDEQGEVEEGVRVVEQALAIDPANTGLHLRLASLEAQRQAIDRALDLVEAALELDPRHLEARLHKAGLLQRQRRFDEAELALGEALEIDPEHPGVHSQLARMVELRQGRLDEAEARLRRALERDPFLVLGYRVLGQVLKRQGRVEEAIDTYRRGLERQPDDIDLHARLGLLLAARGGGAETERHLSEAIRLSRVFRADLHAARGGWLAEQGRIDEAMREYDRVLAVEPDHPATRNNRAVAIYQLGRGDEAITDLEAVIAAHPRHADAYNNLAAIAIHRREWPEVVRRSRQALQLDATMAPSWNNLAVGLEEQGDLAEAEKAYRRALDEASAYWQARFNLGVLLRKAERFAEAAAELEAVIEAVPGMAETHLELGNLYADPLADPAKARLHWNAFLAAAPGHPVGQEVRRRLTDLPAVGESR